MKCPYCGSDLYIDNYSMFKGCFVCGECDKIIEEEEIEDEN